MFPRSFLSGAALLLAAALPHSASAQADAAAPGKRLVDCELTVGGKSYLKGVCEYGPTADEGFQISGDDYFAYVSVFKGKVAEASWNADPLSTHAHAALGKLKRKGDCWASKKARICVRPLAREKEAAARAALPQGVMLYPSAASSACLGTDGPLEAGRAVTLRNCRSMRDRIFTVAADGTLGLDRRADLCLDLAGQLILAACRPDAARWKIAGEGPSAIRSTDGNCLTIPDLANADAKFPFAVNARPCEGGGDRPAEFMVERE